VEGAAIQVAAVERHALQFALHELAIDEAAAGETAGGKVHLPERAVAEVASFELRHDAQRARLEGVEVVAGQAAGLEDDSLEDGVGEVGKRDVATLEPAL